MPFSTVSGTSDNWPIVAKRFFGRSSRREADRRSPAAIEKADTLKRLEDLYLPYKPKKQTLATIAREKGLGPLADAIWGRDETVANLAEVLPGMVNPTNN